MRYFWLGGAALGFAISVALITYVALCLVVGWVSKERGRGAALGFCLSLLFSPVIGLLVLLALGANSDGSFSALEWSAISGSLDSREYDDFAKAFPGTKEAYTAIKQKRLVEKWYSLDQTDGQVVEEFAKTVSFPELSAEIRKVVELNAASSASVATYLERLRAEEQLETELAERERELQAAKAARLRKKAEQAFSRTVVVIGVVLAVMLAVLLLLPSYQVIDQNHRQRILQESVLERNSKCEKLQASLLAAEVREHEENSNLRERIQVIDAKLAEPESPAYSAQKDELTREVSALRDQLINTEQYRDMEVARDRFYACQSPAEK